MNFIKIDRELSLSEKIEQQLVDAIRQKVFLPGDKLPGEIELAQNFGVSRTAVREALHRLAGSGIVETRKGAGVYVNEDHYSPVASSFHHLLEMKCGNSSLVHIAKVRLTIEPGIAEMAARGRESHDLEELKVVMTKMEAEINNPEKMIQHDIDFHRLLLKASKNPIFPVIMEPIFQMMEKFISTTYEFPKSPSLALESHDKILKAIREQDSGQAFKAMQVHMTEALEHALSITKGK